MNKQEYDAALAALQAKKLPNDQYLIELNILNNNLKQGLLDQQYAEEAAAKQAAMYEAFYKDEYFTFNVKTKEGEIYTYEYPSTWSLKEIQLDIFNLLNYPVTMRQWFTKYTSKEQYLNKTNDKTWTLEAEAAYNAYSDWEKTNPTDFEDPAYDRTGEISSQDIDYRILKEIFNQSMAVLAKEYQAAQDAALKLERENAAKAQELASSQLAELKKANESLLEYLGRSFSAPSGTTKSMEDFFTRVLPYALKMLPVVGTAASMKSGDPMSGFGAYVMGQQIQGMLSPAMRKQYETGQYQRPIYNITNNIGKFQPIYQRTPYKKKAQKVTTRRAKP